jgi:hypothetical protein
MFEAMWVLTNIASGNSQHCSSLIEIGCTEKFVKVLDYARDSRVLAQTLWALANLIGDQAESRDLVLESSGAMEKFSNLLLHTDNEVRSNSAFLICNLFRIRPRPSISAARTVLPNLLAMVSVEPLLSCVEDALWAISFITDAPGNDDSYVQLFIDWDGLGVLRELYKSRDESVRSLVLRVVGNLCAGSDAHADAVIGDSILSRALGDYSVFTRQTKKELCWMLSNLLVGTRKQRKWLMDLDLHVPMILVKDADLSDSGLLKELCWFIHNATTGHDMADLSWIVPSESLKILSFAITCDINLTMNLSAALQILCYKDKELLRIDRQLFDSLDSDIQIQVSAKIDKLMEERKTSRDLIMLFVPDCPKDVAWNISLFLYSLS